MLYSVPCQRQEIVLDNEKNNVFGVSKTKKENLDLNRLEDIIMSIKTFRLNEIQNFAIFEIFW